jgi:acetyltransferase-like isoleucine patch superfamily enzyme
MINSINQLFGVDFYNDNRVDICKKIFSPIRRLIYILLYKDILQIGKYARIDGYLRINGKNGRVIIGDKTISDDLEVSFYGSRDIGLFQCGRNCRFGKKTFISPRGGQVILGDDVFLGERVIIQTNSQGVIKMGNNVMIAPRVKIYASNHDLTGFPLNLKSEVGKDTTIGNNVWIGTSAIILAGVNIGENVVIGAGSVISKDIPPYSMAAGNPAKIINKYDYKAKKWIKYDERAVK